jgi:membrane-associated phospholipid phosphatase
MKWKPLLTSFGIIAFLWITFLSPWTVPLWEAVDLAVFKALNSTLKDNKFTQYFWALLNHKRMDLVEDVVFLLFFIWGIFSAPKEERGKKTSQFISVLLFAGSVIYFVNRLFLRKYHLLPRESPSLVVTPNVRITQEIPWMELKDETITSFPADHATTLLLFGFLFSAFVPRKLATFAWCYVVLRCLPRLVVGAHWFSDIAVGGLTIALFFVTCFLYTPFGKVMTNFIQRLLPHGTKKDSLRSTE